MRVCHLQREDVLKAEQAAAEAEAEAKVQQLEILLDMYTSLGTDP